MDFFRDEDNTLCLSSIKYIEKLMMNYERMFGQQPKQNVSSLLEKGDHPETDSLNLLDAKGTQMYQSMIGALQWMVTNGQLNITAAVMTMSGFRVATCTGHLERVKLIYGYLPKMNLSEICVRTNEPDYFHLPEMDHEWSRSVVYLTPVYSFSKIFGLMIPHADPPYSHDTTHTTLLMYT
jgi:hypothetical protein